jgi:hypothetical protein
MKTFQAYLMAEFRRALPFLPWLLGLHAMTLGARTRWAGEFSNQLVGMIEWTSWAIALLVAVTSLWHDAPLRRERFLSTRPQRFLPLLLAKWIALTLIIVLPFGIVDFLALKSGGFSGKFLGLGALQTLLLFLAALCALFPAVWWWRSVSSAFTALGVTFAALITTGFLLSRQTGNRNLHGGEALGFPLGAMLVLTFLMVLAITSAAFLYLLRKPKDLIRIPVFAVLACLSMWIGLRVSVRPPTADEVVKPSLVAVSRMSPGYQKAKYEWFNAQAPATPPKGDIDVVWSFSKLKIDGRDSRPWTQRGPSNAPKSYQVRSALARRFGNSFSIPGAEPAYHFPTIAMMPGETKRHRSHEIEFELLETHYRWEVVVDMPLKEGASAGLPDSRWMVTTYRPDFAFRPDQTIGKTALEIRKLSSALWIGSKYYRNMFHQPDEDCPGIVDPASGVMIPIQFQGRSPGVSSGVNQTSRLEAWALTSSGNNYGKIDFSRELRFVVLRPTVVRRVSHAWKSPGPVDLWTSFAPLSYEPRNEQLKGTNLLEWLGKNPVPPPDASAAEAESWFGEFYPLLRANEDQIRDRDSFLKMLAAFSPFVIRHPQVALKATEEHSDLPWLLQSAIRKNLPRDTPQRFPQYATNRFLMESFIGQGWAGDLAKTARDRARMGLAWRATPILLAVPQEIGLTEAEWLEYFRLNPEPEVYNALFGKVVTRERLDRAVDEILKSFRIQPRTAFISPGLDLALARGRKEAPRWLKEDFEARIAASSGGHMSTAASSRHLETYFDPPKVDMPNDPFGAMDKKIEWFLSIDPGRFVFDPATRKYQLRNDP